MFDGWGERIKHARRAKATDQKGLATQMGVSVGTISRWEREATSPSKPEWSELAKVLECRIEWLQENEGPMEALTNAITMGTGSGKTQAFVQSSGRIGRTPALEGILPDEGSVNWQWVISAHDEVLAYIEMEEEFSRHDSDLREKLAGATELVYGFIVANEGNTPSLREMKTLMREILI